MWGDVLTIPPPPGNRKLVVKTDYPHVPYQIKPTLIERRRVMSRCELSHFKILSMFRLDSCRTYSNDWSYFNCLYARKTSSWPNIREGVAVLYVHVCCAGRTLSNWKGKERKGGGGGVIITLLPLLHFFPGGLAPLPKPRDSPGFACCVYSSVRPPRTCAGV